MVEKEDARGDEDQVQICGSLVSVEKRAPKISITRGKGPEDRFGLSQMLQDRGQSHAGTAKQ